jgi:hypothetical protein
MHAHFVELFVSGSSPERKRQPFAWRAMRRIERTHEMVSANLPFSIRFRDPPWQPSQPDAYL